MQAPGGPQSHLDKVAGAAATLLGRAVAACVAAGGLADQHTVRVELTQTPSQLTALSMKGPLLHIAGRRPLPLLSLHQAQALWHRRMANEVPLALLLLLLLIIWAPAVCDTGVGLADDPAALQRAFAPLRPLLAAPCFLPQELRLRTTGEALNTPVSPSDWLQRIPHIRTSTGCTPPNPQLCLLPGPGCALLTSHPARFPPGGAAGLEESGVRSYRLAVAPAGALALVPEGSQLKPPGLNFGGTQVEVELDLTQGEGRMRLILLLAPTPATTNGSSLFATFCSCFNAVWCWLSCLQPFRNPALQ